MRLVLITLGRSNSKGLFYKNRIRSSFESIQVYFVYLIMVVVLVVNRVEIVEKIFALEEHYYAAYKILYYLYY